MTATSPLPEPNDSADAEASAALGPGEPGERGRAAPSERPAFALEFPRTPELDALVDAFERGNYALVRAEAPKLAERAADPAVAAAARELRARLDPDPVAYLLLALPFALLVFLSAWFVWHAHR